MSDQPAVLPAENSPEHQYITRGLPKQCGCQVIEAINGEEAVALALSENPDMILSDLKLPVLDGFEAAPLIPCRPTRNADGRLYGRIQL